MAARPIRERIEAWVSTERARLPDDDERTKVTTIVVSDPGQAPGEREVTRVEGVDGMSAQGAAEAVEARLILYAGDPVPAKGRSFDLYLLNGANKVVRGPWSVIVRPEHIEQASGADLAAGVQLGAPSAENRAQALQLVTWQGAVALHAAAARDERAHTIALVDRVLTMADGTAGTVGALNAALVASLETHRQAVRQAEQRAELAEKRAAEWETRARRAEDLADQAADTIKELQKQLAEATDVKSTLRDVTAHVAKIVARDVQARVNGHDNGAEEGAKL